MKPLFSSQTIWAGIIGIICSMIPFFHGHTDEVKTVVGTVLEHKAATVSLVSSIGIILARIAAFRFDKSLFQTRAFWIGLVGLLAGVVRLFGVELSDQEVTDITSQLEALLPAVGTVLTTLWAWYGRAKATKTIALN